MGNGTDAASGELPKVIAAACVCGGELQLEYYTPLRSRPVEWFFRCRACGDLGSEVFGTTDAALIWAQRG